MMKRVISLSLCLIMLLSVFTGCAKEKDENDFGAYVNMYLSDPIYNFDPMMAYGNESALKVISLLFDNLFVLGDNGKVEKSLAKEYKIDKKLNTMTITLNSTSWSDGTSITAEDVVFAWRRVLDNSNSSEAAALLFDIKNARAAKENSGGITIDDVGVSASGMDVIIEFENREGGIDYDRFLLNLTSYALVPLSESSANRTVDPTDWAKKPSLFVTSGPFKIRDVSYKAGEESLVLERNTYYYRNPDLDDLDVSVTPYRLCIDFSKSDAEIMKDYKDGKLFFVGDIPMSVRGEWKDEVKTSEGMSTTTLIPNQNAIIRYYDEAGFAALANEAEYPELTENDGEKLFANAKVREALSMALNRDTIAKKVVFAEPATALVPTGVFNEAKKVGFFGGVKTFREAGKDILAITDNVKAASDLLIAEGVTAANYMFSISVPAYDDSLLAVAEEAKAAWTALGFKVAVNAIEVAENQDADKTTDATIKGIMDDIFYQNYRNGAYDVAIVDMVAPSVDPFSVLAPFAQNYTGRASGGNTDHETPVYITGYKNDAYTALIEEAYAAADSATRTQKLHEAEELLMADLPVIPVVYNQTVNLASDELSKYEITYYGTPVFTKLVLKNYLLYAPAKEEE